MSDEHWFDFRYQFIETGWFDYDRHKTIEAMRKLSERIPYEVLENLSPLVVFAPSPVKLGEMKPFGLGDRLFLYLGPRLERERLNEVDFIVAHEFAHVALGHYKPGATTDAPGVLVTRHEDAESEKLRTG
jgi:hypothetical protein